MENKKIVIKKILSQEFKKVDEDVFVDENLNNTIDDKFFEPINEENIDKNLEDILKVNISLDSIKDKLSEEELKRASITLAKRIFELAQTKRETRDSVYLNAFNVVLESYRISDQFRILKLANQFFLKEYREYIENRGERPEILSQIMRRVGKDNEAKYRHIVNGIDLEKLSKNVFEILYDNDTFKRERIKNLFYGNNKNEISALRSKVNVLFIDMLCEKLNQSVLQYKQINKKNEDILFEIFADKEENKKYFYTYASPEEKIKYILEGREKKEIDFIKERYAKLRNNENAFEDDLKIVFSNMPGVLENITNGLNYKEVAIKIKNILFPENNLEQGTQIASPGEYHKIYYKVPLNAINILKDINSLEDREFFNREKILQEFSYLKGDKAKKLNDTMQNLFGFKLDESIFPEMFSFYPEKIAFDVNNALFLREEVFKIVEILRFYDFEELNQIKSAYLINFNKNMVSDILDYTAKALKIHCDDNLRSTYEDIFSGLLRLDSNFDLVSYVLQKEEDFPLWHVEHTPQQDIIDSSYKIAEIINDETLSLDEIKDNLTKFISSKTNDEIAGIKQVLYNLLEPKQSLSSLIIEIFGKENASDLVNLIENFSYCKENVKEVLLPDSPLYLQNLIVNKELSEFKNNLLKASPSSLCCDNLSLIKEYSLYLVRNIYTYLLRNENINAFLKEALELDFDYLKSVEYFFNAKLTSLRRLLKELNVKNILSNEVFAIIFLRLENIDENIIEVINDNIKEKKIRELLKLFTKYPSNQKTLEDIYEVIVPNNVPSPKLKQLIKDSGAKLTDINECILYLDEFFPSKLAQKLHEIVDKNKDNETACTKTLISLLKGEIDPSLIPEDPNWKIEQNYISTLYYKVLYKENFVSTLRNLNFSNENIIEISKMVYGDEIVDVTLTLEGIVEDDIIDENEVKVIKEILPLRQKRFLMIVRDFFNNYTLLPKKLEEYIEKNEEVKKIFLGA